MRCRMIYWNFWRAIVLDGLFWSRHEKGREGGRRNMDPTDRDRRRKGGRTEGRKGAWGIRCPSEEYALLFWIVSIHLQGDVWFVSSWLQVPSIVERRTRWTRIIGSSSLLRSTGEEEGGEGNKYDLCLPPLIHSFIHPFIHPRIHTFVN